MPEAEIRATGVFGRDGNYLREVTPDWILTAVARMVEHPDYRAIQAPLMAIYAVYQTPAQLAPRYNMSDSATQSTIEKIFEIWRRSAREQREEFRKAVPQARVIEIRGASHYVFISHRDLVLKDMRSFLEASK